MAKNNIEMSEYQAKEITDELKDQAAEVSFKLLNHHMDYQSGSRNRDIDAAEVREAGKRLVAVGGLLEMLEEAREKAREAKK